jgi:hypothetical protein
MGWYAKPAPLLLPSDTNTVLEALYGVICSVVANTEQCSN